MQTATISKTRLPDKEIDGVLRTTSRQISFEFCFIKTHKVFVLSFNSAYQASGGGRNGGE